MEGDLPPERRALLHLESAVGRLLAEGETREGRLRVARERVGEVEGLLRKLTRGEVDPAGLAERVRELEAENADLRARIQEAGEGVDRLLARIRFLEEQGER